MFGGRLRLWLVLVTLVVLAPASFAHESWISRGAHRNAAGEWCCGEGDCFVIPSSMITMAGDGYVISGDGSHVSGTEKVPFTEAQPSPDGAFWRCQRPDGSRRCFFAPPPGS